VEQLINRLGCIMPGIGSVVKQHIPLSLCLSMKCVLNNSIYCNLCEVTDVKRELLNAATVCFNDKHNTLTDFLLIQRICNFRS